MSAPPFKGIEEAKVEYHGWSSYTYHAIALEIDNVTELYEWKLEIFAFIFKRYTSDNWRLSRGRPWGAMADRKLRELVYESARRVKEKEPDDVLAPYQIFPAEIIDGLFVHQYREYAESQSSQAAG